MTQHKMATWQFLEIKVFVPFKNKACLHNRCASCIIKKNLKKFKLSYENHNRFGRDNLFSSLLIAMTNAGLYPDKISMCPRAQ